MRLPGQENFNRKSDGLNAFTLVELLAVLAILSAILGLTAIWMVRNPSGHAGLNQQATLLTKKLAAWRAQAVSGGKPIVIAYANPVKQGTEDQLVFIGLQPAQLISGDRVDFAALVSDGSKWREAGNPFRLREVEIREVTSAETLALNRDVGGQLRSLKIIGLIAPDGIWRLYDSSAETVSEGQGPFRPAANIAIEMRSTIKPRPPVTVRIDSAGNPTAQDPGEP